MPFGTASFDYEDLPPLEHAKPSSLGTSLFSDSMDLDDAKQVYCLALVDEATGTALRVATEEDLAKLLEATEESSEEEEAVDKETPFQELLASTREQKGTPTCMHCGVTESPQWRRGPSEKPVLCNACGTRFRRTHQLTTPAASATVAVALPAAARKPAPRPAPKRAAHGCARELAVSVRSGGKSRGMKQPRMVA